MVMRLVDVSFFYDDNIATPEALLQQHYTITGWSEALQQQGLEVTVLKRLNEEHFLSKNNVQHHFIKDRFGGMIKPWHFPFKFLWNIRSLNADVVHVHGFMFPVQVLLLRLLLNKKTAIIVQHHGGYPPKGLKGYLYSLMNNLADGFFFSTIEQGAAWFNNKKQQQKVMPVMEGSNHFNYCQRVTARTKTQLEGNPIFLWVGRLDDNKDPLTVLNGFERLIEKHPTASLYMIYSDDELLQQVQDKINHTETLKQAVHLLGSIPHNELENYYNSSDYFVLGSHYEGSGYALSEALACGCIPIVTSIPSFNMMTDNGRLGALCQTGSSESFVEAATIAMNKNIEVESKNCVVFFKKNLSFDAIASTAVKHYQKAIDSRL